jgi:hypothetical protein
MRSRRIAIVLAAFVAAGCNRDNVPLTGPSAQNPPVASFDLDVPGIAAPMVSAGDTESCAVRAEGTLACWGANYWGVASPPIGI